MEYLSIGRRHGTSAVSDADSGFMQGAMTLLVGVAVVWAAVSTVARAQTNADLDATITIINAIEINQLRDLQFGDIIPDDGAASSLTINPNSTVSSSGPATFLGPFQAAQFRISGAPGLGFTIAVPDAPLTIFAVTNDTMTVDGLSSSLGAGSTIPGGGTIDLFVGGRLTVGASQATGLYSGTFSVSVNYD